jgi:hypothetical protein
MFHATHYTRSYLYTMYTASFNYILLMVDHHSMSSLASMALPGFKLRIFSHFICMFTRIGTG